MLANLIAQFRSDNRRIAFFSLYHRYLGGWCLRYFSCRRLFAANALFLFFCINSLDAQTKLWGLTPTGGDAGFGAVISLNDDGSDFNSSSIPGIAGGNPGFTELLKAANGKFYGMTAGGGSSGYGVLFEYDPAGGGAYSMLHDFDYTTGAYPNGCLTASGGKFYGMTSEGGSLGYGVLFEYDPSGGGAYTVLHEFDYVTGSNPYGSLIESGGKFYGMTLYGGSSGYGALFEYDPSGGGAYAVLYEFDYTTGGNPYGSLIESGGKFYGMTNIGGSLGYGVLFEYDPAGGGAYNALHEFDYTTGGYPYGSLTASGGKFYGMTSSGGSLGYGVLFEYDPAGGSAYNVLHDFDYTTGGYPYGSLTASGGKFYGMTYEGGSLGYGVLFEYDPAGGGAYNALHEFDYTTGAYPYGSLIESGGKFYGMTSDGGSSFAGVLFEYDPMGGAYSVLATFFSAPDGAYPYSTLIESGGKFYGMTSQGGSSFAGVVFEYDPSGGGTYSVLHEFDGTTGGNPNGSLIESGGKFYGMAIQGGSWGYGVLFEYDPAGGGAYSVLHEFDNTTGAYPRGSLIESGGKFYGMTWHGGSSFAGVLFEYDPAGGGTYTVLHDFDNTTGGNPHGSLIESGGKFYGMTLYGGSSGYGVLFEYDPSGGGVYSVLHEFDYTTGGYPYGSLIESGGKFYGMTNIGGSLGYGVLFEYDPAGGGAYSVLHDFDNTTGAYPYGSLIESGGKFYGMTRDGGSSGYGVVFEYDLSGAAYTVLKHLQLNEGAYPYFGSLLAVESSDITISGALIWEHDDITGVGNATVALTGDQTGSVVTPADGTYSFTVPSGSNFTVTPTKTINKLNGITVADATAVQKHVAGIIPITDPYKLVGADVNKSNTVTTLDAVIILQSLAGNPSALANFKTSWRFAPVSHPMSIPPWGFPEKITLTGVSGDMPDQDFFGIKTGDVVAAFANPANFGAGNPLVLNAQDQVLLTGATAMVEFKANQLNDLAAFQFALKLDPEKLALAEITPLAGLPLTSDNFGTYNVSEGEIRAVWSQAEGAFLEEAAPVFSLKLNVLQGGGKLSEALRLDEAVLPAFAYNSALAESKVELKFGETTATGNLTSAGGLQLFQNRPNPFSEATTIGFVLPESCEAQLSVFDVTGRVLFAQKKNYTAGRHEETLDLEGATGVLYYELVTPFGNLTRKMVALGN